MSISAKGITQSLGFSELAISGGRKVRTMFNAVLDTNILVSGLLSAKGNPARIINAFRDKQFNLFYNAEIAAEYRDVLFRNRLGFRVEDINALLESIYIFGLTVQRRLWRGSLGFAP